MCDTHQETPYICDTHPGHLPPETHIRDTCHPDVVSPVGRFTAWAIRETTAVPRGSRFAYHAGDSAPNSPESVLTPGVIEVAQNKPEDVIIPKFVNMINGDMQDVYDASADTA